MVHPRIVPWADPNDLVELKGWFYAGRIGGTANELDMRARAIQRVKCYQSKGSQYLPHVIDSTAQITSAILLDEDRSARGKDSMFAVRLSYAMALIRFVNGLLDPTQQSQFAIPLHTLAQRVGLSSWFVDLRHWGTHERELPSIDMLRVAAKEALEWLWDHYWNDDELQEEENSEDEKESEEADSAMSEIRQLIRKGMALNDTLAQYRWVWEDGSKSLICSTNFAVENEKNKKSKASCLSPQEQVNDYVYKCRDSWRRIINKRSVIEILFEKGGHGALFDLFMAKLVGFDLEVLGWIAQSYQEETTGVRSTLLRRKFPTWNDLKRKCLKKYVSSLNLSTLATYWNQWSVVIEANPSFVTLWICASILKRLDNHKNQSSNRKKRKKRRQTESIMDLESRITPLVEQLSKRFSNSDVKLYDLSSSKSSNNAAKPVSSDASEILADLANLRQRLHTPKIIKSQETKLWNLHPQWEPKPFGSL